MTSKAWWAGALASAALAFAACHPNDGSGMGQIGVGAQFPRAAFRTQVIPATTAAIEVTVSGDGMTSALSLTLTAAAPTTVVTVPAGPKTVSATARDAEGKALAKATAAVTVVGGAKTSAILDLVPEPETEPSPTPQPSTPPGDEPPPGIPTVGPSSAPTAAPTNEPQTVPLTGVGSVAPAPAPTPTISALPDPSPGAPYPTDVQLHVNDGSSAPAMGGEDI